TRRFPAARSLRSASTPTRRFPAALFPDALEPQRLTAVDVADAEAARLGLDAPLPDRAAHRQGAGRRSDRVAGEAVALRVHHEAARRGELPLREATRVVRERRDLRVEVRNVREVDVVALRLEADDALLVDVVVLEGPADREEQVIGTCRLERDRRESGQQVVPGRGSTE